MIFSLFQVQKVKNLKRRNRKMAAPKVEAPKAKPAAISKPTAAKPAPPPQARTPLKAATARPGPPPKPSPSSKPAVTKPAASSRLAAPSVSKNPIKFAPKPAPKAEEEPGAETEEELVPKEVEEPVESEPETVPTEEIEKPMPSKVMKKGQSNDLAKTGLFIMAVMESLKISGFPVKPMGQLPLNKWMVKFVTSNSKMEIFNSVQDLLPKLILR